MLEVAPLQVAVIRTWPETQRASAATSQDQVTRAVPEPSRLTVADGALVAFMLPYGAVKTMEPVPGLPAASVTVATMVTTLPLVLSEVLSSDIPTAAIGV